MQPPPIELRAERGVADVVNATLVFLRQNARPLGRLLATTAVPLMLLASFVGLPGVMRELAAPDHTAPLLAVRSGAELLVLLLSVGATALAALAVLAYMRLYAERGPGTFALADVRTLMAARAAPALLLLVLVPVLLGLLGLLNVIPLLGTIVFVVGVAYLGVMMAVAFPVLVWEDEGPGMALARASRLLKGEWWRTLGLALLLGLVYVVITMAFYVPALGVGFWMAWQQGTVAPAGPVMTTLVALTSLLASVGNLLVYSVPLAGMGLQYLSLVEEQEQVGLRARVAALADGPAPPAGPAPPPAPPGIVGGPILPPPGAREDDSRWAPPARS